jgi:hypothetical protein
MSFVRRHGFIQRLALTGVLAVFAGVAHASTITYNLEGGATNLESGAMGYGGTVTGTLTIDTTTDLATDGNLAFNGSPSGDFVFNTFLGSGIGGQGTYDATFDDTYLNYLYVYYDTSNIGSGDLGIEFMEVGVSGTYSDDFAATLDPVSSVPEPSSCLLLGTGILSLAGIARRRFLTA